MSNDTSGAVASNFELGPNADDVERLRFEALMTELKFNLRRHVDRPHQYANANVQGRWSTWQAAVAAERNEWAEIVAQLIACHDEPDCPAVALARAKLNAQRCR